VHVFIDILSRLALLIIKRKVEIRPWLRLTRGKVQIFERVFSGGRWYRYLPVILKTSPSLKMLDFQWLSIKYPLDFSTHEGHTKTYLNKALSIG
jgi:hypothetical protein